MARRGKYPKPDVALTNFRNGVDLAPEKWRQRTHAGEEWWDAWYSKYFVPRLFPQLPGILAIADPYARSRRVGAIVKAAAAEYRRWKLTEIVRLATAAPPAAVPA